MVFFYLLTYLRLLVNKYPKMYKIVHFGLVYVLINNNLVIISPIITIIMFISKLNIDLLTKNALRLKLMYNQYFNVNVKKNKLFQKIKPTIENTLITAAINLSVFNQLSMHMQGFLKQGYIKKK